MTLSRAQIAGRPRPTAQFARSARERHAHAVNDIPYKVTIFLGFFPFLSPAPMSSDLQPLFFLLALALLFTRARTLKIHKYAVPLILFGLYQLIPIAMDGGSYRLTSRLDGGFAAIALVFFYTFRDKVTPNLVYAAMLTHLAFAIVNFVLPSLWGSVIGPFMHQFRAENVSVRGAGGANPEAGFLGAFGAFFMAMGLYYYDIEAISRRKLTKFFLASAACVLLSKSGTGFFLYALAVFLYILARMNAKKAILVAFGLALVYVATDFITVGEGNRGLEIMARILQNPSQAITSDVSIMLRVFPIISGINSLLQGNLFGHGPGSFDGFTYSVLNAGTLQAGHEVTNRIAESGGGASAIGRIMVEFGLIGLMLPAATLILTIDLRTPFISFLSLAFILASFSFAFPVTWLIAATSLSAKRDRSFAGAATAQGPA